MELLQILEGKVTNQMPVVDGNQLVGMITRDHLLRILAAKMELAGLSNSRLSRGPAAGLSRRTTGAPMIT